MESKLFLSIAWLDSLLSIYIDGSCLIFINYRLKLKEKITITFENFYAHFKDQEPKGYPAWMDPVKRPNESKMLSATQAHLQLKAMVRER